MRKVAAAAVGCLAALITSWSLAHADDGNIMSFQAVLTDETGEPIAPGVHTLDFFIYASPTGGVPVGSVLNVSVTVAGNNGVVSTSFGPIDLAWFAATPRYLGITIDDDDDNPVDDELSPRTLYTVVPFALRALSLPPTSALIVQQAQVDGDLTVEGRIGAGTSAPQYTLHAVAPSLTPNQFESGNRGGIAVSSAQLGQLAAIDFNADTPDLADQPGARIAADVQSNSSRLLFGTSNNLEAGVTNTAMVIDSLGRIGLGILNPQSRLHVGGAAGVDGIMFPDGTLQTTASPGGIAGPQGPPGSPGPPGPPGDSHWLVDGPDTYYSAGRVGIGTAAPQTRLHVAGTTTTTTLTITGGADIAEPFDVVERTSDALIDAPQAGPGMVVIIDPDHPGRLCISTRANDRKVAGVISGANGLNPGLVLRAQGEPHADGRHNVALSGRVWCWVDATAQTGGGPVAPGDLLTTSATPGHAMKVADDQAARGAILGKAMTALPEGRGLVLVLVSLQ